MERWWSGIITFFPTFFLRKRGGGIMSFCCVALKLIWWCEREILNNKKMTLLNNLSCYKYLKFSGSNMRTCNRKCRVQFIKKLMKTSENACFHFLLFLYMMWVLDFFLLILSDSFFFVVQKISYFIFRTKTVPVNSISQLKGIGSIVFFKN